MIPLKKDNLHGMAWHGMNALWAKNKAKKYGYRVALKVQSLTQLEMRMIV